MNKFFPAVVLFVLCASPLTWANNVNDEAQSDIEIETQKWFEQHDYLFTEEFFSGDEWMELSYDSKYKLVQDYYTENDLDLDVRKGILTLDMMFRIDDGLYRQYSVYAVLDRVVAEVFLEEASGRFYPTATS